MSSETLTDFRKAVLERLHGCSYNEAAHKENGIGHLIDNSNFKKDGRSIFINEFDVKDDTQQDSINVYNPKTREIETMNAYWHHYGNFHGYPITLGRLMAALGTLRTEILISHGVMVRFYIDDLGGFYWQLLREDKTECDETDQTEETLIALTNIL